MSKRKGTRNEHRSGKLLEAAGYRVTRAAASLGEFDLIGISSFDIVLLQVKSNRNASPAEREAMRMFAAPSCARKLIHIWHDRQRIPEVREP